MSNRLYQYLFAGISVELLLFAFLFLSKDSLGEVFRLSARYTGRISFGVYIIMFFYFIKEKANGLDLQKTYSWGMVFCVLHFIHFIFLSLNVYINQVPLVPYKLTGGFLAYLAILVYPFYLTKINRLLIHLIYFYYVGIVMAMTFLARIRGEFVGSPRSLFHYFGILIVALFFLITAIKFLKIRKPFRGEKF